MKLKYRTHNPEWDKEARKYANAAQIRPHYKRMETPDEEWVCGLLEERDIEPWIWHDAEMVHTNYDEFVCVVLDKEGCYHKLSLEDVKMIE